MVMVVRHENDEMGVLLPERATTKTAWFRMHRKEFRFESATTYSLVETLQFAWRRVKRSKGNAPKNNIDAAQKWFLHGPVIYIAL